jgi:hypothetical protein
LQAKQRLDKKSLEAARQYRLEPGMCQRKTVPMALTIEVNFNIYPEEVS